MKVQPFQMPPFLRIQWVSKDAQEKYEPLLHKASNVFRTLEKETVIRGIRDVTTDSIDPLQYKEHLKKLADKGLYFIPMQKVANYKGFATYHPAPEPGKPWHYYGVICKDPKKGYDFIEATEKNDHKAIGRLLGYPECCLEAFEENFIKNQYSDSIWQQALATKDAKVDLENNIIKIKSIPWESNNIFKAYSASVIFHTKCSLDCNHTEEIAKKWINLAEELKVDGLKEVEIFSRLPYEWDALKGIAVIRTPLFKIETNSVSCVYQHRVQVGGSYFPIESAKSNQFPWSEEIVTYSKNGNKLTYEDWGAK